VPGGYRGTAAKFAARESFFRRVAGLLTSLCQELAILALVKTPLEIAVVVNDTTRLPDSPASPNHAEQFRAIYQAWFNDVARWVVAMGGRAADRDDLVQDVFLVVFRRLPDFDGQNVGGWLYQITRRRVRDFRRSMWLRRLMFGTPHLAETAAGRGFDPSETLETTRKRELLERLLESLNEPERVALVLFELEDYSGEQIAELQGVPTNTVWARIRRARLKLSKALTKLESPESIPAAR
jgi:RNA polymerase sigma-70 factor (ECF subfamily)